MAHVPKFFFFFCKNLSVETESIVDRVGQHNKIMYPKGVCSMSTTRLKWESVLIPELISAITWCVQTVVPKIM